MNKCLLPLILVCMHTVACAETDTLPPVEDNSRYVGGVTPATLPKTNGATSNQGSNSANASRYVMGQLEQLQKEVRQLSGTVEEQAHELAEVKRRQKVLLDDMDQRIRTLESGKSPEVASDDSPTPPIDAAATPEPPVATPPPAPKVEKPPVAPPAPAATPTPKPFVSTPKPAVAPVSPATAPNPAAKEQYQAAYDTLRDGHYSKAIAGFNNVLANYPNSEYSPNAQYWLGEAYKVSQNPSAARDAFNKVVSNYPTSPKVPDALFKLGILEFEQNNLAKAKEYLNKVSSSYPNTSAANLARKKLAALNGG